jgi:hypothetical protein
LFSFCVKVLLALGDVKPQIFDLVLTDLSLFLKIFCIQLFIRDEWDLCTFKTVLVVSHCKEEVRVCSKAFFAGCAHKSDARAVSKMAGEFLKPCGRWVQVNCCPPDWGWFSHWKAKMGWLTGANWMQKNASFESKHEKQVVSAGIRTSKVYGLGTTGCRASAA